MDHAAGATKAEEGEDTRKSIYIGNLNSAVTEELLLALFNQFGSIVSCKLLKENSSDPFAFIEFENHSSASMALTSMYGRVCMGKKLKVNWQSHSRNGSPRVDVSGHYHIYVGDISFDVSTEELREAFSQFGNISSCKIVRDARSVFSKTYGFISFETRDAAETAIKSMNGYWIKNRSIRTNWATRKPWRSDTDDESGNVEGQGLNQPTFEEVSSRTCSTNTTVFCGNVSPAVTDATLKDLFSRFGEILEIRMFTEKKYAFVRFSHKASAVRAIIAMNQSLVCGSVMKVSWGKSTGHDQSVYFGEHAMQMNATPPFGAYGGYGMQQWHQAMLNSGYPINPMYPYAGGMQQQQQYNYHPGYFQGPVSNNAAYGTSWNHSRMDSK